MRFNFEATGVGSVPFADPEKACSKILSLFKEIPFWPQLPKRTFLENMYVQFAEGMPGIILDEKNKNIGIDKPRALDGVEGLYQRYLDDDLEFFRISKDRAAGLYAFLDAIKSRGRSYKFIKGHLTGPASMGLSLAGEDKIPLIYNAELSEALTKLLSMKARWQIRKMKEACGGVIIFIDEPYLVSIGSSFVNIDIEKTIGSINEVAHAIHKEDALAGLHCCGNTDWGVILRSDIDILNFDAYNFMKQFTLYRADIKNFLGRGGTIAWGAVPTAAHDLEKNSIEDLIGQFKELLRPLEETAPEMSSLITPSCGVGTLAEGDAEKALGFAAAISQLLKDKGLIDGR